MDVPKSLDSMSKVSVILETYKASSLDEDQSCALALAESKDLLGKHSPSHWIKRWHMYRHMGL